MKSFILTFYGVVVGLLLSACSANLTHQELSYTPKMIEAIKLKHQYYHAGITHQAVYFKANINNNVFIYRPVDDIQALSLEPMKRAFRQLLLGLMLPSNPLTQSLDARAMEISTQIYSILIKKSIIPRVFNPQMQKLALELGRFKQENEGLNQRIQQLTQKHCANLACE